jgi:hypothetical protein
MMRMSEWYIAAGQRQTAMWCVLVLGLLFGPIKKADAQGKYTVLPSMMQEARAKTMYSSQPTEKDTRRVTLTVHDSTIGYVVHELVRQAHLLVVYDTDNPAFAKRIDFRVDTGYVMNALATALQGTGLSAKLAGDGVTILIRPAPVDTRSQQAQAGTVSGRVIDSASGKGISGATVSIKGTKLSVLTT